MHACRRLCRSEARLSASSRLLAGVADSTVTGPACAFLVEQQAAIPLGIDAQACTLFVLEGAGKRSVVDEVDWSKASLSDGVRFLQQGS